MLSRGLGQGGHDCRQGEDGRPGLSRDSRVEVGGMRPPGMLSGLTAVMLRGPGTAQRRLRQFPGWWISA